MSIPVCVRPSFHLCLCPSVCRKRFFRIERLQMTITNNNNNNNNDNNKNNNTSNNNTNNNNNEVTTK